MDDKLVTPATQIKFGIFFAKPGELRLEEGIIAFTSGGGRLVFRAQLQEVRASFPKVFFFGLFPIFDTGINLALGGRTYRLSCIPVKYGFGSWQFSWDDVKQGKAAVRQWRAALGQPA